MPQDVHSKRDVFDATYAGSITRPLLPPLRSDSRTKRNPPRSLRDYQGSETEHERKARLRALWLSLPQNVTDHNPKVDTQEGHSAAYQPLTKERAQRLRDLYESELARECNGHQWLFQGAVVDWEGFLKYAESKEEELWKVFHNDLDLDGNGMLDATELQHALTSAGIELDSKTLADFMAFLTSSTHSRPISFPEFRDFLLLLPRTPSVSEIFQYYEVCKYLGDDGRGSARVNMEGDVSLSAEDRPPAKHHGRIAQGPIESGTGSEASPPISRDMEPTDGQISVSDVIGEGEEEEEEHETWLGGSMALKFLFAGGVAVSRTCTAPFDRLKIYLITRKVDNVGSWMIPTRSHGVTVIANAMRGIYLESGLLGFWIGNGLNVVKIFPESAIKFLSYEASKRMFARYWDHVDDSRDISGISRFMAGGIGGITSQLAIYPIETVKTQLQSTSGGQIRTMLAPTMRRMWADGGVRAYYRGLAAGLIGVFPYSAIDMSTFEALKLAYIKASGKEEPGVLALLAFGSVSGSVGATSVYPINLVRTRLQASGSSGHPQRYTGVWDVAQKTYAEEGWRGFYRGLAPTLAKVIPAVSISYVVYEHTKRRLGV